MWKILGAIVLVSMLLAALKLAIIILALVGLVFRTKETLGLLAIGAVLALWRYSPVAGGIVTGLLILLAIYGAKQPADTET